jgi:hypothetical protein
MAEDWVSIELDDPLLESGPPKAPGPIETRLRSIPTLVGDLRRSPAGAALASKIRAHRQYGTRTLILKLETVEDPLLLWATHRELDVRNVAPALRWPCADGDEQVQYITWCADLLWLCVRYPDLQPAFRGWRHLLTAPLGTHAWHAVAFRQYIYMAARYSTSYWTSKGLALTDTVRMELMTVPTKVMAADRRELGGARFEELRGLILDHAATRPDRSGRYRAHEVANRRAAMWRTYVLCGRRQTVATAAWTAITGEPLTRQAFAKQIAVVAELVRRRTRGLTT